MSEVHETMKSGRKMVAAWFLAAVCLLGSSFSLFAQTRSTVSFDDGWLLLKGDAANAGQMNLPIRHGAG